VYLDTLGMGIDVVGRGVDSLLMLVPVELVSPGKIPTSMSFADYRAGSKSYNLPSFEKSFTPLIPGKPDDSISPYVSP